MTYQQATVVLFAFLMFAGHLGQAPTAPTPTPTQAPAARNAQRPANREEALITKLKALLEPVGVAIEKSALADPRKVKRNLELVIHWDAYPDASEKMLPAEKVKDRPVNKAMRLDKSERREGSLQPVYGFDLSTDKLFIAAVNAKSHLVWWDVRTDPRVMLLESFGPNGEISGGLYYSTRASIFITVPDEHGVTEIRIYQPQWDGAEFTLEQLATIPVAN